MYKRVFTIKGNRDSYVRELGCCEQVRLRTCPLGARGRGLITLGVAEM